jgi:hypothetical protein
MAAEAMAMTMTTTRNAAKNAARAFTNTKRCAQAFAKLNGWSVTNDHFSFRQLAGKGRAHSNDEAPRWWRGDQDIAHVLDHIQWFRQNRRPIAIVCMPYGVSIEDAQEMAQRYGLVACAPPIECSGWWLPKYSQCFAFVRSGTTVRWLPGQCDAEAFEEFAAAWEDR